MTNNQRDELLISLSKGLNNLQCNFNDFRTEIKTEINQVETRLNKKFDGLTQEVSDLKVTVNQNNDNLSKEIASVKKYAEENIKSIPDIFREIYKTNYEQSEHLKKHDIEIKDLQEKLA